MVASHLSIAAAWSSLLLPMKLGICTLLRKRDSCAAAMVPGLTDSALPELGMPSFSLFLIAENLHLEFLGITFSLS